MRSVSRTWYPAAQQSFSSPALSIERAQGAYLYAKKDRAILDATSSDFTVTRGHCAPKVVEAIQEQAMKLGQIPFARLNHEAADQLTDLLVKISQRSLDFIFYAETGSAAIENALKMAIGYYVNTEKPRQKILAFEGAYHGASFATLALSEQTPSTKLLDSFLFDVARLPFPAAGYEELTLQKFEDYLKIHGYNTAALVIQPLLQFGAGVQTYAPEVLSNMHNMCKEYGILLIADETRAGFGRTGTTFACEQAGITPDISCLSGGLTGGMLPLAATLATKEVYKAFYQKDKTAPLMKAGPFAGNPLACAAAAANLKLWQEEPLTENIEALEVAHKRARSWFEARPDVGRIETIGTMFCLQLPSSAVRQFANIDKVLFEFYLEQNVFLEPVNHTLVIAPPYCIKQEELDMIYDALWRSLDLIRDEQSRIVA